MQSETDLRKNLNFHYFVKLKAKLVLEEVAADIVAVDNAARADLLVKQSKLVEAEEDFYSVLGLLNKLFSQMFSVEF